MLELDRDHGQLEQLAPAEGADGERPADALAHHQALEVAGVGHGHAVDVDDQVLVAQPGPVRRAAVDHLDDLDPGLAVQRLGDTGRCGRPRRQSR